MRKRRLPRWLVPPLVVTVLIAAGLVVVEHQAGRDCRAGFAARKGELESTSEQTVEVRDGRRLVAIELANGAGIRVRGYLSVVDDRTGGGPVSAVPAMIVLGGLRTGRRTIEYLEAAITGSDLAVLALDYPYEGKKSGLSPGEFLLALPGIRRAIIDTPPAVMLCVDYLSRRGDIDTERIVLAGGSLGALFTPAVAASDERIDGAAILFGAGDIRSLLLANIDLPAPLAHPCCWLGARLVSPVEPLKYVGLISPRPLFILNGIDDPRLPEVCVRRLQESAAPPTTVRWIEGGHVNVRSTEFHELVSRELTAWLSEHDLIAAHHRRAPPDSAGASGASHDPAIEM